MRSVDFTGVRLSQHRFTNHIGDGDIDFIICVSLKMNVIIKWIGVYINSRTIWGIWQTSYCIAE